MSERRAPVVAAVVIAVVIWCATALTLLYVPIASLGQLGDSGNPQAYVTAVFWAAGVGIATSVMTIAVLVARRRLPYAVPFIVSMFGLVVFAFAWVHVVHTPQT